MVKQNGRAAGLWGMVCMVVFLLGLASSAWCDLEDFDGFYTGTYSGDENGYWVSSASSNTDEYVFLSYAPDAGEGDVGLTDELQEIDGKGYFNISTTEIQKTRVNSIVDSADGSVTGTWVNPFSGDNGTLEGQKMTSSPYEGNRYSGTFAGADAGTWSVKVAADGAIDGSITSYAGGGSRDIDGICHPDGYLMMVNGDDGNDEDDGFVVFGAIAGSSVSGVWYAEDGGEGTISGNASGGGGGGANNNNAGAAAGGGDGGGGGCFLSTLAGE